MEQIFVLMAFLGAFSFISFGICTANSIEAKQNKKVAILLTGLTFLGAISFLIGISGIIIISILYK